MTVSFEVIILASIFALWGFGVFCLRIISKDQSPPRDLDLENRLDEIKLKLNFLEDKVYEIGSKKVPKVKIKPLLERAGITPNKNENS